MSDAIATLQAEIAACRICRDAPSGPRLPHEPRPVAVLSSIAPVLICGQAPGTRVHASGRPFTDPSGDRLRSWLGVDAETFYDPRRFAIVPMGFCFPGHDAKGGDLPPRNECRAKWHERVFAAMPQVEVIVAIGMYAQAWHLGQARKATLTETVADWRSNAFPENGGTPVFALPHPSWRNNAWLKRNGWFEAELLPELRKRVFAALSTSQ